MDKQMTDNLAVIKRNGDICQFDGELIINAVKKAVYDCTTKQSITDIDGKELIVNLVLNLDRFIDSLPFIEENNLMLINIETIQDLVIKFIKECEPRAAGKIVSSSYESYRKNKNHKYPDIVLTDGFVFNDLFIRGCIKYHFDKLPVKYIKKNESADVIYREIVDSIFRLIHVKMDYNNAINVIANQVYVLTRTYSSCDYIAGSIVLSTIKSDNDDISVRPIGYIAAITFLKSYLKRDNNNIVVESIGYAYKRMTDYLSDYLSPFERMMYMDLLCRGVYSPGTPGYNAGKRPHQLASCFVITPSDDMDSLAMTARYMMLLIKSGGGIGINMSHVRESNAAIGKNSGSFATSDGVIPLMNLFDSIVTNISQKPVRMGATTIYLDCTHPDLMPFLSKKDHVNSDLRFKTANIAVGLRRYMLEQYLSEPNSEWHFVSPLTFEEYGLYKKGNYYGEKWNEIYKSIIANGDYHSKIPIKEVLSLICKTWLSTGSGFIFFVDNSNEMNPLKDNGFIGSSNLCTEIMQNTSRFRDDGTIKNTLPVCILGSVNLKNCISDKPNKEGFELFGLEYLDVELFANSVWLGVKALDSSLSISLEQKLFPVNIVSETAKNSRDIGLGLMGFYDLMIKHKIPVEDRDKYLRKILEFFSYNAIKASMLLAKDLGSFPLFKQSEYAKGKLPIHRYKESQETRGNVVNMEELCSVMGIEAWEELAMQVKANGIRNANITAIAPTATISTLTGATTQHLTPTHNIVARYTQANRNLLYNHNLVDILPDDKIADIIKNNGQIKNLLNGSEFQDIQDLFKTGFDLSLDNQIKLFAATVPYICQAASASIAIDIDRLDGLRRIVDTFISAERIGMKSIYYALTESASGSLYNDDNVDEDKTECDITCQSCQ